MASLEYRESGYRVVFMWGGKRIARSLKNHDEKKAEALTSRLEDNLADWERGRFTVPDGADVATFLLSNCVLTQKPQQRQPLTLGQLFDQYFNSFPEGELRTTLSTPLLSTASISSPFWGKISPSKG